MFLYVVVSLLIYAGVSVAFALITKETGHYPDGSDTMFYVYRGDYLYHQILSCNNWYPLLDPAWYNGVETFRYWSPSTAYLLAGTQALAGGDLFAGYIIYLGATCFANCAVWTYLGVKYKRPWMGFLLGLIWFFFPNNLFMLFGEGVIARALAMVVMPLFVAFVYDYLKTGKWKLMFGIVLTNMFVVMCHVGWAGMLALTTLLYLAIYAVMNRHKPHGSIAILIGAVLSSFLICGIWVFASLKGGITGLDQSQIMANFFQSLNTTLNPFKDISFGYVNRWSSPFTGKAPYFGLASMALCIFGVLFAHKRQAPGFLAAAIICLLTASEAYPFLVLLPGAQYLWMLRFLSIALTFMFVAFFFWRTLRVPWQALFYVLLVLETAAASVMFVVQSPTENPYTRFETIRVDNMIDIGNDITTQRFSFVEPLGAVADTIYVSAGYGDDTRPTSFGQGVQAAVTYSNIVRINEASENMNYYYMFDRLRELGNDTVMVPCGYIASTPKYDPDLLADAAAKNGYELIERRKDMYLYHLKDAPEHFGTITKYPAIGIGKSANIISQNFPAVREVDSYVLDDFTFEELSQYKVIYLSNFVYKDRVKCEELVKQLADAGVKIVILADGIPSNTETGRVSFLDVEANTINFTNGYPLLDTKIGLLTTKLFPEGYAHWKTVYLNGLDKTYGTIEEDGKILDFYGTKYNDNIIFVGLNLTFFQSLTHDEAVNALLADIAYLTPDMLPDRQIVPIDVEFLPDKVVIRSDYDGVNTTVACHDIFSSDEIYWKDNNLTYVNAGTTVIKLNYPYLKEGIAVSAVGLLIAVLMFIAARRQNLKLEVVFEGGRPVDWNEGEESSYERSRFRRKDAEKKKKKWKKKTAAEKYTPFGIAAGEKEEKEEPANE